MYSGQSAGFAGLTGSVVSILNGLRAFPAAIAITSPTQIVLVTPFAWPDQPLTNENAIITANGSGSLTIPPSQNTGLTQPVWNTNYIGTSGSFNLSGAIIPLGLSVVTRDYGLLWANLGPGQAAQPVYYDGIVGSEADMDFQMSTLRNQLTPGQTNVGPIGQYQVGIVPPTARAFFVYFFNLMWEYGPALYVYTPPPADPTLTIGYFIAGSLQLILTPNDPVTRNDYQFSTLEIASDPAFNDLIVSQQMTGLTQTFTVNVPVTGSLWARAVLTDFVSSGSWSNTIVIPQQTLISSTYLAAQGSIPPTVAQALSSSGGIFVYTSTSSSITIVCNAFGISYSNGGIQNIPAFMQSFIRALDSRTILYPLTPYGFFPSLLGPLTTHPVVEFNGPYAGLILPDNAQFIDGSVPLTNGVFVCQTASTPYGSGSGGGGGTNGGANCGVLESKIRLEDGSQTTLALLKPGRHIRTIDGKVSVVVSKTLTKEKLCEIRTETLVTKGAYGHTLKIDGTWMSVADMLEADSITSAHTIIDENDKIISVNPLEEEDWICRLELRSVEEEDTRDEAHVYELDGFWSHNTMIKSSP
jgi:hypothetical protein